MGRNLEKEDEWSKEKYERINARIDKQLGISLKLALEKEGKSIAGWISENAEKYLSEKRRFNNMDDKLKKAEEILKSLELRSTHGNVRNTLKSNLNSILSECYNSGLNIDYLAVDYPMIKEIKVYKTNTGIGQVVVEYESNFRFKEEN